MSKYRTIVADPPWPYPDGFGQPGPGHLVRGRKRTNEERGPITRRQLPYRAMTLEQIGALPLADIADRDARLFLWATNRHLPVALRLLAGWGFAYRQLLVWDKTPNFNPLSGSVAATAAEFLVVGVRGKPGTLGRWPTSVIGGRKPRSVHSAKPDVFLDLVEQVSPGPYLEMFARRARFGWDYWGDESLGTVEMPASTECAHRFQANPGMYDTLRRYCEVCGIAELPERAA